MKVKIVLESYRIKEYLLWNYYKICVKNVTKCLIVKNFMFKMSNWCKSLLNVKNVYLIIIVYKIKILEV